MNLFKREPVMAAVVAGVVVPFAARYGFDIPESSLTTLFESVAVIIAALFARSRVSPVEKA